MFGDVRPQFVLSDQDGVLGVVGHTCISFHKKTIICSPVFYDPIQGSPEAPAPGENRHFLDQDTMASQRKSMYIFVMGSARKALSIAPAT